MKKTENSRRFNESYQ